MVYKHSIKYLKRTPHGQKRTHTTSEKCRSFHTKMIVEDIRGGASLLIASLIARGVSAIEGEYHIERGYADIYNKLERLGAAIQKN